MDANETSVTLLNIIRKSNLNFSIVESPFSLSITIKKSFIKNKNGSPRSSGFDNPGVAMQQQTFVSGNQPQVSTIVKKNSSASTMDSKNSIIANTMVETNITARTNSANPNMMFTKTLHV